MAETPRLSVVVLSKTAEYLKKLVDSILRSEPQFFNQAKLILVDDGVEKDYVENLRGMGSIVVSGKKPFVYARNANLGITEALKYRAPILLINDDTTIKTPFFLSRLQNALPENYVCVSASIIPRGGVGNKDQSFEPENTRQSLHRIEPPGILCFVACFFQVWAFEKVGYLDERFVGYGYEDNDWCLRASDLGFLLGVTREIVVEHNSPMGASGGTFKREPNYHQRVCQNMILFQDKNKMNRRQP